MARVERKDINLSLEMDEIEERLQWLKIQYEKYFMGIERVEPIRDRDDLRRRLRHLMDEPINNATQRFRFQQLRAKMQSMELYWTRNLVMIERGTHPKHKFRANIHGPLSHLPEAAIEELVDPEEEERLRRQKEAETRQEQAYKAVYDRFIQARQKCGQSTDVPYETMRGLLQQQIKQVKEHYHCESVQFKIVVEEGRARIKASAVAPKKPEP